MVNTPFPTELQTLRASSAGFGHLLPKPSRQITTGGPHRLNAGPDGWSYPPAGRPVPAVIKQRKVPS